MARSPETEIERVKNEVEVVSMVEAPGIELKKGGRDLLGRCPFHEDDTASVVMTPAKNLWHCFGCGVGGTAHTPRRQLHLHARPCEQPALGLERRRAVAQLQP